MIDTFIPPSAWLPQGWQPLVQAVVKVVRTASIALSCMRASDEPCIFTGRLQKYSQLRSRGLCCAPENLTALCRGVGTPQPTPHERHLQTFQTQGRPARPASIGYGRRTLVEIAMNKPLQGADRHPPAGAQAACPTNRNHHRRGGAQPHPRRCTPEIRPL
jgi:hypothetical protein